MTVRVLLARQCNTIQYHLSTSDNNYLTVDLDKLDVAIPLPVGLPQLVTTPRWNLERRNEGTTAKTMARQKQDNGVVERNKRVVHLSQGFPGYAGCQR